MSNLLEQAISAKDPNRAAKIIQHSLGIESDEVANYAFPKRWPTDRAQRAQIIGEWLQTEARFLGSPMSFRAEKFQARFEPCLPRSAKQPPAGPGWIHEIKHDGFRIIAQRDAAGVRLLTRKDFGHGNSDHSRAFLRHRRRGSCLPVRGNANDNREPAL